MLFGQRRRQRDAEPALDHPDTDLDVPHDILNERRLAECEVELGVLSQVKRFNDFSSKFCRFQNRDFTLNSLGLSGDARDRCLEFIERTVAIADEDGCVGRVQRRQHEGDNAGQDHEGDNDTDEKPSSRPYLAQQLADADFRRRCVNGAGGTELRYQILLINPVHATFPTC